MFSELPQREPRSERLHESEPLLDFNSLTSDRALPSGASTQSDISEVVALGFPDVAIGPNNASDEDVDYEFEDFEEHQRAVGFIGDDVENDSSEECSDGPQSNLEQQRRRMQDLAERRFDGPQMEAFRADIQAFERRITAGPPPLTAQQVADTYEQISRLLSDNGPRQRLNATIGGQILRQAAVPSSIDQFPFPTCQTTVLENRMYTMQPQNAARLVADIALSGSYTYTNTAGQQRTYSIDADSRTPASTHAERYPVPDRERSMASQLFQVTGINMVYNNPGSTLRYVQHPLQPGGTFDFSTTPPERVKSAITNSCMLDMAEMLGVGGQGFFLLPHNPQEANTDRRLSIFRNVEQMEQFLQQAQRNGQMPIIIGVSDTFSPTGRGTEWAGSHVACIRSYQPGPPPRVEYDDQLGSRRDRLGAQAISIAQLYALTQRPADLNNVNRAGFQEVENWYIINRRQQQNRSTNR